MQTYEFNLAGAGNVHKSGETQPRPSGSEGSAPGGSGGTSVVGKSTPVIVATGAENNG